MPEHLKLLDGLLDTLLGRKQPESTNAGMKRIMTCEICGTDSHVKILRNGSTVCYDCREGIRIGGGGSV